MLPWMPLSTGFDPQAPPGHHVDHPCSARLTEDDAVTFKEAQAARSHLGALAGYAHDFAVTRVN